MSTWRPIRRTPAWLAWMPGWLRTTLKWTLWSGIAGAAIGLLVVLFYFSKAARFDLDEVGKMPARTAIYDRHGKELGSAGPNNRRLVTRAAKVANASARSASRNRKLRTTCRRPATGRAAHRA